MISNKTNLPMDAIGNLWENLTDLSQRDPDRYQEIIKESTKEYAKLKSAPLPNTCFYVKEKVNTAILRFNTYLVFG